MSLTKAPLLGPLLGRKKGRRVGRPALVPVCGHCRSSSGLWPVSLPREGSLHVCRICGGITGESGEALTVSLADGSLRIGNPVEKGSAPLPGLAALVDLETRTLAAVTRAHALRERPALARYVAGVRTELVRDKARSCALLDVGEPYAAGLPAGALVVSLGLLAVLRDEAQLAFVLAREVAIAELGLPARRLAAAVEAEGLLGRLRRGGVETRLADALVASLGLGWGAEVELRADQMAVDRVVSAGYSPLGALDALRALEEGSLEGRCGRFVAWERRVKALERRLSLEPPARVGRLNAEVYRRAVGGFAVFAS